MHLRNNNAWDQQQIDFAHKALLIGLGQARNPITAIRPLVPESHGQVTINKNSQLHNCITIPSHATVGTHGMTNKATQCSESIATSRANVKILHRTWWSTKQGTSSINQYPTELGASKMVEVSTQLTVGTLTHIKPGNNN